MEEELGLQERRDTRRNRVSFSTVVRLYNRFDELLEHKIFDSSTRSGATRKANGWLKETCFLAAKKTALDNYQYWHCYDIADIEMNRIEK